jgi:nucleoredoxin
MKKALVLSLLAMAFAPVTVHYAGAEVSKPEAAKLLFHKELSGTTKDSLFQLQGKPDPKALDQKKYVFVYFSASWCPPCRTFTPKLVDFYKQNKKNGDFELLFVSCDENAQAMKTYMKKYEMPWIGVTHGSKAAKEIEKKYAGNGIPCLVLLNEKDEVIAGSYDEKGNYKGPGVALQKYKALKKAEK